MSTTVSSRPKRVTTAQRMAFLEKGQKIPNPMPLEERMRIHDLADEAKDRGDHDEAERLQKTIPLEWHLAMAVIEQYGSQRLLDMGFDLSYAVMILGEDFVYGD